MPRRARIHYVSLKSSLVNLPISIYGPLLERSIRPQGLAVHLKLVTQNAQAVEAYVGWTGMASSSSLAQFSSTDGRDKVLETLEIDPQYAQSLGFGEGDVVEIGLLHDLSYASSVSTEPVTADDWEIVVRVAKIGQEIDVWVMGQTRVRLTVVSLEPSSKGGSALLTTDTEVSIAPKTHQRSKGAQTARDIASQRDPSTKPSKLPETVLRVLPTRLLDSVSPFDSTYTGPGTVAFVHPYIFALLTETKWPSKDEIKDEFLKLSYRHLQPPSNPLEALRSRADAVPANSSPQSGAGDPLDSEVPVEFPAENILFIGSSYKVLESHVFAPSGLEGIDNWHWIHVRSTGERKTLGELFKTAGPGDGEEPKRSSPDAVLSGVEQIIKEATNHLLATFIVQSSDRVVQGLSSILVTGRPGVGKTSVAREIAKRLEEDTRTYAYKILSPEVEHTDSFRSRIITEVFIARFSANDRMLPSNFRGMVMIGTAESKTSLHPLVHTLHIFQEVYHLQPPTRNARKEILDNLVKDWISKSPTNAVDAGDPPNYAMIASNTEGYGPIDLQILMKRALLQSSSRAFEKHGPKPSQITISMDDFSKAQVDFVPSVLKDLPLQKSDVEWADIGGLKEAKRILRETMEWPTKYAPLFKQSPLRLRSGIMLYGYPGCGKTLLASAVSKECGLNFISIKGPELLNKYIGASEKSVRDIFDRASAAKPCVLFFDDGHDSTGVTDRVVNQLLTEMDGVEGLEGVFVLAATSRPDLIDSALLRPGRLDKSVFCDMPNEEDRKEILQAVTRKVTLDPSVDLGEIAKATENFTGADLQALVYNAHLRVVHTVMDASPNAKRSVQDELEKPIKYVMLGGPDKKKTVSRAEESQMQKRLQQILENRSTQGKVTKGKARTTEAKTYEITQEDFMHSLKTTRPSLPSEEMARFRNIFDNFMSHRSRNKKLFPSATGPSGPLADPEQNTQLLTEQLRSLGLYAAHTLGDGNCLFRALSDQFYGSPARHLELRRDICDWIESHRQRYEPFCEDERGLATHLQCMRQQGTYGGHLELSAFAHFARRNVKVIQPGLVYVIEWHTGGDEVDTLHSLRDPSFQANDETDTREKRRLRRQQKREEIREDTMQEESPPETVYVAYHDWEHFSSVRNLRGPHTGLPHVTELPAGAEPPSTPMKKKPSLCAKAKPESKTSQKYAKKNASTVVKAEKAMAASPAQIPLPESRSPSPDLSEYSTQADAGAPRLIPVAVQPAVATPPASPLRIHRSPKRTFDESSGSSLSDIVAKRTRSSRQSFSRGDVEHDAIEVDDPSESTPELSGPGSPHESSPLSSAASSPSPTTPPTLTPPPEPERRLTRRQRKALGLPKPRSALAAKRVSAGKIVIPGGRYKRGAMKPVSVREDNGDDEGSPQDEEWQRNGTGRLDVRGFRELKI
ncbi:hypothetical protein ID866_3674 [Astraeus odoratus]|nr:hypothetical protein ID866_3674 [Astraeus odoratus]